MYFKKFIAVRKEGLNINAGEREFFPIRPQISLSVRRGRLIHRIAAAAQRLTSVIPDEVAERKRSEIQDLRSIDVFRIPVHIRLAGLGRDEDL
jgi:hypothetical protein